MNYNKDEQLQHPIIQKHRNLLENLSSERIFSILFTKETGFSIIEGCDDYFSHDLRKDEAKELSKLFEEISKIINR